MKILRKLIDDLKIENSKFNKVEKLEKAIAVEIADWFNLQLENCIKYHCRRQCREEHSYGVCDCSDKEIHKFCFLKNQWINWIDEDDAEVVKIENEEIILEFIEKEIKSEKNEKKKRC